MITMQFSVQIGTSNWNLAWQFPVDMHKYWHKRSHSSRLAFRRSTGNDVSGHYKCHYFPFSFIFSPSQPFFIEVVLGSKKFDGSTQKPRVKPFQTPLAILGPPTDRCCVAGGELVPSMGRAISQTLLTLFAMTS